MSTIVVKGKSYNEKLIDGEERNCNDRAIGKKNRNYSGNKEEKWMQ